MNGPCPVELLFVFYDRTNPLYFDSKKSLGTNEINIGQEFIRLKDIRNQRTDKVGKVREDTNNLPFLFSFQFPNAVIGFHYAFRFDKDGFATG